MTTTTVTDPTGARTSDPRLARGIGVLGLLMLVSAVPWADSPMFTDASNAEVLRWVHGHVTDLYVGGFVEYLAMLLNGAFLAALAWRARVAGPARGAVWAAIGASLAIDAVNTGSQWALAKAADRGAGSDALLGFFGFAEQLTFTDGITWGVAIAVVSVASLRARTLAAPICWLGVAVAVVHLVAPPVQLAWTGTPEGAAGPISVALLLFWWLALSLSLLIRPRVGAAPVRASTGLVD